MILLSGSKGAAGVSRYRIAYDGKSIEVVTHFGNKCELLVDGRQVDSGRTAGMGGTTKFQDTASGLVVNVTTGSSLYQQVTLLANGTEIPVPRQ